MQTDALVTDLVTEVHRYSNGGPVHGDELEDLCDHVVAWLDQRRALADDPVPAVMYLLTGVWKGVEARHRLTASLADAKVHARIVVKDRTGTSPRTGDDWRVTADPSGLRVHRWTPTSAGAVVGDFTICEMSPATL